MKLKFFPSCAQHPRTTSFRLHLKDDTEIFKTINSVYDDSVETPESWFTHSSESASSSSEYSIESSDVEAVIRGAQKRRNERMFFEPAGPGESSSLILEPEAGAGAGEGHVTVAVDSEDPLSDFKKSMAEMVESLGVRDDLGGLKELLAWFLKVNHESNHGYIFAAFFDLVNYIFPNNNNNNNNNDESSTSFFSAAAASLSSSASARLFSGDDSDHIIA